MTGAALPAWRLARGMRVRLIVRLPRSQAGARHVPMRGPRRGGRLREGGRWGRTRRLADPRAHLGAMAARSHLPNVGQRTPAVFSWALACFLQEGGKAALARNPPSPSARAGAADELQQGRNRLR